MSNEPITIIEIKSNLFSLVMYENWINFLILIILFLFLKLGIKFIDFIFEPKKKKNSSLL